MAHRPKQPMSQDESGKSLDRLVAFSDGVFAIAMTLLVLNLTVPSLRGSADSINDQLWETLKEETPELFSYALSFWVIGRYWLVHHRIFRLVRRADTTLMVLNLVLLLFIALIPYPTEMLGRYGDTTTAVVFYSVAMVAVGVSSAALNLHILRANLLDERVTMSYRKASFARSALIPAGFALGIPVALADPLAGMLTWWIAIFGMSFFIRRHLGDVRQPYAPDPA